MVSKASDALPLPDRPVMTTSLSRGSVRSMFLRLCCRAPRISILSRGTEPKAYKVGTNVPSRQFRQAGSPLTATAGGCFRTNEFSRDDTLRLFHGQGSPQLDDLVTQQRGALE